MDGWVVRVGGGLGIWMETGMRLGWDGDEGGYGGVVTWGVAMGWIGVTMDVWRCNIFPGAPEVLQCLADVILALDLAQLGEVLLPCLALVRWQALSTYHHLSLALAQWEVQVQEVQLVQEMQELCEP